MRGENSTPEIINLRTIDKILVRKGSTIFLTLYLIPSSLTLLHTMEFLDPPFWYFINRCKAPILTTGYTPSSEGFLQLNKTVNLYDLMARHYHTH